MFGGNLGILALGLLIPAALTFSGCPCVDRDGDGYGDPASSECSHSLLDCDDTNPDVNPGAQEGPAGDATCSDEIDNDCDGDTDSADELCERGKPRVDSVTPGSAEGSGLYDKAERGLAKAVDWYAANNYRP